MHYSLLCRSILIPADAPSKQKLFKAEHVKSIVPLDHVLGIADLPFKMSIDEMKYAAVLESKGFSADKIKTYAFAFDGKTVLIR